MSKNEQFGERLIEACRQVNEQMKSEDPFGPMDAQGWYAWGGSSMIRPAGKVDVLFCDGTLIGGNSAESWVWQHRGQGDDIVKWRPAQ